MSEILIGDRVEFVDERAHKIYPAVYPECGTIGTVTDIDKIGIFKSNGRRGLRPAMVCGMQVRKR